MRKHPSHFILVIFFICSFSGISFAQPHAIGELSVTYNDPDRNNRSVPTRIFYPSTTGGTNAPFAEGAFPVIAFGHGFIMVYSAYQYLWEALVPEGYILALPTTEGSITPAPNHLEFGLDLRFLVHKLKSEGDDPASLFYQHVADSAAVMGHSMGGGSSFLACQNVTGISAMITLAAAETNPSAIQAAQEVHIPALVIAGSFDCVTPPPQHQEPMYAALASSCKTYISITGGGHCYFANYNFNCSLGELFCNPPAAITRAEQHAIVLTHLIPYLDFMLKGNVMSWITFNDLLDNPAGITSMRSCHFSAVDLKVFLEGPFNGTEMETTLHTNGHLPLEQPYNQPPWQYTGDEEVSLIPGNGVTDWILVEFRDAENVAQATGQTVVARQAGFVLKNGKITAMDGFSPLLLNIEPQNELFAVVWHRNHVGIISSNPLTANGILYSYDFSSGAAQAYGGILGHKQLAPGIWGMAGADGNADKQVNNADKNDVWAVQAGNAGYTEGDFGMDGQVNNSDKIDVWAPNTGFGGQVPD